jgi:hypothetical protein
MTLPITGTLIYLSGNSQLMKLHVSVGTGGQQITSDSWVTTTSTVINQWEIASTDPTTCQKEVLSGDSYPRCTPWQLTPRGIWSLECTVTAQGNKATLGMLAVLSSDNKLVSLQENTPIGGIDSRIENEQSATDSITITMTEQGTTPPVPSDFDLPSICNAPNGNSQGENGQCTGTIPSICL